MSHNMDSEDQSMIPKDEKETDFGPRLDYTKPVYRDFWCGVIYYIHLIAMVAITCYIVPQALTIKDETDTGNATQTTEEDVDFSGAIVVVISCAILGLILGFCWLSVLKRYALAIIKAMIFLNITLWVVLIVVGIFVNIILSIVAAIMVLFWALYFWCMRDRIKFSSVLLSLSSQIINSFPGTVCVTITMITITIVWVVLWGVCFISYIIANSTETTNDDGETVYSSNANVFAIFLLLVSLYWVIQVNSNISHTTNCGVAASWYFTPPEQEIGGTMPAFQRSMTTSFGSICLGSFLVAILQAIRAMIEMAEGRKDGNGLLLCLVKCCVVCIQRCIEWFNTYAFAHCAIYGTSFMTSAGATWRLLSTRGILALINEDLTGMALFAGGLISAVVCGLVGAGIAYPFYTDTTDMIILLGVYGAICGLILTLLVLNAVRSAIICLFVCFAEEPAVLYENRREDFNELAGVKPEFQSIYDSWGMKSV